MTKIVEVSENLIDEITADQVDGGQTVAKGSKLTINTNGVEVIRSSNGIMLQ